MGYGPMIEALNTARCQQCLQKSISDVDTLCILLPKVVGAIAWVVHAPDRNWFAHWLVEEIHESSYSEAERMRAGHRFQALIARGLGFTKGDGEVGDEDFENLFP